MYAFKIVVSRRSSRSHALYW